ncbi:MAG: tetratricopeptide repeat protein, partial [Alphaproteobacteria bacterium]|nr:tetratricopeptide repeat protein [Alphaproteobacteria bacterium]
MDDTLFAFFDLALGTASDDILRFLVLADIAREEMGLRSVQVVLVPTVDGNSDDRANRLAVEALCLLPSCRGHANCGSRAQAAFIERRQARHRFPDGYSVDRPIAAHDHAAIEAAAANHRVDRLRAPEQARSYVRKWLEQTAMDRPVVAIPLSDDGGDAEHGIWSRFAEDIAEGGFAPVLVPGPGRSLTDGLGAFGQTFEFTPASVNSEIRAALFSEAFLNFGPPGAWSSLCRFLEGVPHLSPSNGDAKAVETEFDDEVARLREKQNRAGDTTDDELRETHLTWARRLLDSEVSWQIPETFRPYLEQDGVDPEFFVLAGAAAHKGGDHALATRFFEKLPPEQTREPKTALQYAEALREIGRRAEALEIAGQALAGHPDHVGLLVRTAELEAHFQHHDDAIELIGRARALCPDDDDLVTRAGGILVGAGRFDAAAELLIPL